MKSILVLGLASLGFAVAGCSSFQSAGADFKTGFKEKFQGPIYRTHVVSADQRATYDAALQAVETIGFRITRSGAAQGIIEGLSGLGATASLDSSRQRALYLNLANVPEGTEINVRITEIIEDSFRKGPRRGTENTLYDTPLYEVFFENVERTLAAPPDEA